MIFFFFLKFNLYTQYNVCDRQALELEEQKDQFFTWELDWCIYVLQFSLGFQLNDRLCPLDENSSMRIVICMVWLVWLKHTENVDYTCHCPRDVKKKKNWELAWSHKIKGNTMSCSYMMWFFFISNPQIKNPTMKPLTSFRVQEISPICLYNPLSIFITFDLTSSSLSVMN